MATDDDSGIIRDLRVVSHLLKSQNVFLSSKISTARLYNPSIYIGGSTKRSTRYFASVDRSTVSRIADMVRGRVVTSGNENEVEYRTAAASLAFLRLTKIRVEHNISTYQLVAGKGNHTAADDISDLRIAWSIDPAEWVKLATGASRIVDPASIVAARRQSSFAFPPEGGFAKSLGYWNMYYVFILKLLALHRNTSLSAVEKAGKFFTWQLKDALFSSIGSIWAFCLFSDLLNSKSFRNLDSSHLPTLRRNLDNEVWDMLCLQQWKNRFSGSREPWLLNIQDNWLYRIASCIFT